MAGTSVATMQDCKILSFRWKPCGITGHTHGVERARHKDVSTRLRFGPQRNLLGEGQLTNEFVSVYG